MKSALRFTLVAMAAVAVLAVCGCQAPPHSLQQGDAAVILLSIKMNPNLYFNGPEPLAVRPPAGSPFTFGKEKFSDPKPSGPLRVAFVVGSDLAPGTYTIELATRMMYCNKADDICVIRDEKIPVAVAIKEKTAGSETPVEIPVQYTLKEQANKS